MIRDSFELHLPETIDEAAELRGRLEADVIGGGTWVVSEMTQGKRRPRHVIDLRRAGLGSIVETAAGLAIGATVTYRDVLGSTAIAERWPLLHTLALGITGGPQIQNRGTLGGSACYANPSSDVPAAFAALGATFVVQAASGSRQVAASDFFVGPFETSVTASEVLKEVNLPSSAAGDVQGYYKFKLSESSWPIATAAYVGSDVGDVLALGGVQATPLSFQLEHGLSADEISDRVVAAIDAPWADVLASGDYRRAIAGTIATRAVAQAQPRRMA